MSDKKKIDEISGTETTGHEWDGIEELNTPMPRWWLNLFYACIGFAIVYAILMPAIPGIPGFGNYTKGVLGKSDRAAVIADIENLNDSRSQMMSQLTDATLEDVQSNEVLFEYAMAAGRSAFGDNCATCHGSGAQGFKGYPNLNDDVWLWGGTFDDIRQTLTVGIRSAHPESRYNIMQAFGRDQLMSTDEIDDMVEYIRALGGFEADNEAVSRATEKYQSMCASCHMANGQGDRSQGAPNLTDAEWLFGSDREDIRQTIYNGRQGVMPNWNERLTPEVITALSVYVHSLGGGEETPVSQ